MTIPKSYEALAADLASEKILSKTLLGQKEAYMMLTDNGRLDLATWKQKACEAAEREAALREELAALRESYEAMRDRKNSIVDLQQRLTSAEQREAELKKLLCDVINEAPTGFAALKVDLANRVNSALKPAAEVAAYCTHPPGCKQCSWCGFKAESKLAADGEGS